MLCLPFPWHDLYGTWQSQEGDDLSYVKSFDYIHNFHFSFALSTALTWCDYSLSHWTTYSVTSLPFDNMFIISTVLGSQIYWIILENISKIELGKLTKKFENKFLWRSYGLYE